MKKTPFPHLKKLFPAILVLAIFGVSCVPTGWLPQSTPVLQTVEVTREVTQEVTREVTFEVTREVTQLVDLPVTVTPSITPEMVGTMIVAATPTKTPVSGPAIVRISATTECYFGPSYTYKIKYAALAVDTEMEAFGRSVDGEWLNIQTRDHQNPCWAKTTSLKVLSGDITNLALTDPVLSPYSTLYTPPQAVSTNRVGNEVTIFWLPVVMDPDDYEGYLIEAWVCQGGKQVFQVKTHVPDITKNNSNVMQAVMFVDEPGCSLPSRAVIFSVEKTAYSSPKNVTPWPPAVIPLPTP